VVAGRVADREGRIMVQRELTVADLDEELLLELVRTRDPVGVLSIYDADGTAALLRW
jgi:hypothetical protein